MSTFPKVYVNAIATTIEARCNNSSNGSDAGLVRAQVVHELLLACLAAGDDPARLQAAATAAFRARAAATGGQMTLAAMVPEGKACRVAGE
jgi:hypothetical protein